MKSNIAKSFDNSHDSLELREGSISKKSRWIKAWRKYHFFYQVATWLSTRRNWFSLKINGASQEKAMLSILERFLTWNPMLK